MDDINHEKTLAALERLESEKERRLQEKIDAGELVSIQTVVVCYRDEDVEEATARALARHPAPDGPVHREFSYIFSGLPRGAADIGQQWPQVQPASSTRSLSASSEEPAGSGGVSSPSPPSQPTYVRVILQNGENGDPGQIAEAFFTVEDGAVVLRDTDAKFITSRALLAGEDPAVLARILLREAEEPKDFQRPIHYPKMGLA
jgi:hypothetical protein